MAISKNSSIIDINDLKFIWKVVSNNWYIPLIAIAIFGCAGYLFGYKQTDIYAAKTQILLKSNNNVNTSSIISDNFGYYGGSNQSFIDNSNEIRVISSYDLLRKVLDKVDFDVSYFIVGRIRTIELFDGVPFKVKVYSLNPELYEQQIKFKILDSDRFEIVYLRNGKEVVKQGTFNTEFIDTDFRLMVSKGPMTISAPIAGKEIQYLIQIHTKESLVYKFQASMDVKNPDYTNVLEVTLEDVLPQRAVVFLDTLSQVYIDNTLKSKVNINENTLRYIDKQMDEVTSVLNDIEDTMQGFREKNNILDLTKEGETYFQKLTKYDDQKVDLNLHLAALNDLENYIITDKDPSFLPPTAYIVAGEGFLQTAITELYTMQLSRNTALTALKEPSPAIIDVDKRIENLKKNMLVYIGNSRTAIKQKMQDVEKEIQNYTSDIKTLPYKQRGLVNIQRKLGVNENMYLFLLQRRSNTVIAKATIIPETKVIEFARSMGIVKPDHKKIVVNFILFGLALSLGIIFIRSIFFARLQTVDELKSKTSLPVIGEVIYAKLQSDLIIAAESEPKSAIAESFRTIRTNLQYLSTSGGSQVIVVTSNSPGEGKTFCSLNLAGILAKAGKRVLILELDLHKPRVQKGLNLEADIGISTIVIGKNTIEESVKKTQIEGLEVILSGPLPPNPSEIVLSNELGDIITYGRNHYDYVIIDTPPVGLISDAIVLMKMADVSLFVINTKFPFKDSIINAQEIVAMNKLIHFAFILNEVKRRKSKYYYNRYSYGYGGGYGNYGGYGGGYGTYGSYDSSQNKNS